MFRTTCRHPNGVAVAPKHPHGVRTPRRSASTITTVKAESRIPAPAAPQRAVPGRGSNSSTHADASAAVTVTATSRVLNHRGAGIDRTEASNAPKASAPRALPMTESRKVPPRRHRAAITR